jgi:hypothetical protein
MKEISIGYDIGSFVLFSLDDFRIFSSLVCTNIENGKTYSKLSISHLDIGYYPKMSIHEYGGEYYM